MGSQRGLEPGGRPDHPVMRPRIHWVWSSPQCVCCPRSACMPWFAGDIQGPFGVSRCNLFLAVHSDKQLICTSLSGGQQRAEAKVHGHRHATGHQYGPEKHNGKVGAVFMKECPFFSLSESEIVISINNGLKLRHHSVILQLSPILLARRSHLRGGQRGGASGNGCGKVSSG